MKNKYTISYFIKKFSAIPCADWAIGNFYSRATGQKCALGHCGARVGLRTPESIALIEIFRKRDVSIFFTNDTNVTFPQKTPRGRVLAALRSFRKSPKP